MPFYVAPVFPRDAEQLSPVMIAAFNQDPHWQLLWKAAGLSLPEIVEAKVHRLPRNLVSGRETKRHQKAIDTNTGEIIGYARWALPEDSPIDWLEAQVPEPSDCEKTRYEEDYKNWTVDGKIKGLNYEIVEALSPALEKAEEEILNTGPHLKLDYVSVAPHRQDQGIGSLLLRSGTSIADKIKLKMYVMSTPADLRLYEKHGFKKVRTVRQDDSKWGGDNEHINHFMVRQVGGGKGNIRVDSVVEIKVEEAGALLTPPKYALMATES